MNAELKNNKKKQIRDQLDPNLGNDNEMMSSAIDNREKRQTAANRKASTSSPSMPTSAEKSPLGALLINESTKLKEKFTSFLNKSRRQLRADGDISDAYPGDGGDVDADANESLSDATTTLETNSSKRFNFDNMKLVLNNGPK